MRAKSRLIVWVDDYCRVWGRQVRKILEDDGYAKKSNVCLAADGFKLGDSFALRQHWPEVLEAEGLAVSLAMQNLDLNQREVLQAHYIVQPCDTKWKARMMMISRKTYYRWLETANHDLAGLIVPIDDMTH